MKNNRIKKIIIDKAREIFARYGFKKTTMLDIANSCGKAKSSIYHYFKDKEQIFKLVIEMEANIFKKEISKAINSEKQPQMKLKSYILTKMRILNNLANFYTTFKDEFIENYGFIQKIREKYDKYEIKTIKEILGEGISKGVFNIKDTDVVANAIITASKGFEYSFAIENDIVKMEEKLNILLNILFNGICRSDFKNKKI